MTLIYSSIHIPENIMNKIILDSILLLKNQKGWRDINNRIKKPLRLRYVGSKYEPELKYYCIHRRYADAAIYEYYNTFEPFVYEPCVYTF